MRHPSVRKRFIQGFAIGLAAGLATAASLLALPAAAQGARFDNSFLTQGRPARELSGVTAIVQDHFGFIWIGGENGLARYGGQSLQLYLSEPDNPHSLPHSFIWGLDIDQEGRLWVASAKGLVYYNHRLDRFEPITDSDGQPLYDEVITTVAAASPGQLYLGTTSDLISHNFHTGESARYLLTPPLNFNQENNRVRALEVDDLGNVWVASEMGGVAYLNTASGEITYHYHRPDDSNSLSVNRTQSLHLDAAQRLWIGTYGGGINVLDTLSGDITRIEYDLGPLGDGYSTVIMDILQDSSGAVWVSADQQGALKFAADLTLVQHYQHSSSNPDSLFSNQARALFEDADNNLWIGLFPYGVSILPLSRDKIAAYRGDPDNPRALSHSAILSLLEDSQGTLWVGTENGLNAFDPITETFKRYMRNPGDPNALGASAILSLEEDASGDLWVGTWSGGLHRFNRATEVFTRYMPDPKDPNSVGDAFPWAITRDSEGIIWLGLETGGLNRYRPETDDFIQYRYEPDDPNSLSNDFVTDIIEDDRGLLWITTFRGLNVFDRDAETFRHYLPEPDNPFSISSPAAMAVLQDSRGYIWVGSQGVDRLDPGTGQFVNIDVAGGLPSSPVSSILDRRTGQFVNIDVAGGRASPRVSSILEDNQGYIWLATSKGLARIHPNTFEVAVFDVQHGLAGSTHNRNASLQASDGKLYFGSTEGLTAFMPEDIGTTTADHPIWVTRLKILNREVDIGAPGSPLAQSILTTDSLVLTHKDNMFSFDFVILNYNNPELNLYAYRLYGFDNEWNHVENRNSATYTNLNPGHYVFRVMAKAPTGDWTESEHRIAIQVLPPPWRSWWAYLLYVLLVGTTVYAIYAIGRLKLKSDSYKELSLSDPLTGIYNRAGIAQIKEGLFANQEMKSGVAVMLMDIDHFKRINDVYGHDMGDQVIQTIVAVIHNNVRRGDYVGRWGGEEFILMCPRMEVDGARRLSEQLRQAIASHTVDTDDGATGITVSIGAALVKPEETFEQALKRADIALYQAKARGRNKVVIAH